MTLVIRSSLALGLLLAATAAAAQHTHLRTANDGNVVLDGIPEVPEQLVARVDRYQNARGASFSDWSADGRSLFITTRFAEVTQLHRVDAPGGARRQLTFFREPVGGVSRRPGHVELSFRMDQGGAEFYQLFLFDPGSGDFRRLTDGRSRNTAPSWSDDGTLLAYTSTRRTGRLNDIWVMSVADTASARLALPAPDGAFWSVADWHPGGTQLLVVQRVSINDSRLHLLDLESAALRPLLGSADAPASFSGPHFTADGEGVLLTTDARSEFRQLAYLDLQTREWEVLSGSIDWDVESLELSRDRTRAAFTINEGGSSRLHLLDPATLGFVRVSAVPTGLISGIEFSPNATQLALTLNSAVSPSDVYTLALGRGPLESGTLTRWTYSEVGSLDPTAFVEPQLVHYPTFDQVDGRPRQIPAFVYRPHGNGPHPVIISIHGGPESQYRPSFNSTFQLWLNELGAAVIAPNVRGSAGYGKNYLKLDNGFLRENSVRDIGALLDWIASQEDLDESRVAVYGGSYGGYMVLATAVHYSDRLKAAVERVGISNFVTFLKNTQGYRRDLRRVEYGDERDVEMRDFLDRISPNRHAARITVPLLVAQGQNDPRVPVTESEQIVGDVRASGGEVWYMKALNEGHGFRKKVNRDLFSQITLLFLETQLLGGPPANLGRSTR